MPIAPVSAATDAARPAPTPTTAPAGGDFARALAAASATASAGSDVTDLPSLRLGDMVDAYAFKSSLGAPPAQETSAPAPAGEVQAAAAAGRPGGVSGVGAKILAAGEQYLGIPYKWGGTSASTGFDCSGFVQQVFSDLGVSLPRVSADQAKAGTAVASMAQAKPGDLIYWNGSGGSPNHIAIYAGNGKMLESPNTGNNVRYQDISRTPHAIRRVM